MAHETVQIELGPGKVITFDTGKLAKQAGGSAVVRIGDTMVLMTVCMGGEKDADFFPLMVEYREKAYAVGKIPGGYIKREARPSTHETLTSRLIDRPIRPLFPDGMRNEVQVTATVINYDGKYDGDALAISGASLAVGLSTIPFEEQVAAVRVCKVNGEYIVFPSNEEVEESDMELIVAGSASSIVMVEGGAYELPEEEVVEAIQAAHIVIKQLVALQDELIKKINPTKVEINLPVVNEELFKKVEGLCVEKLKAAFHTPMVKHEHYPAMAEIKKSVKEALAEEYPDSAKEISKYFGDVEKREMREIIMAEELRIDGRDLSSVRPIEIDTGLLPNCHGTSVFQRGETQALVVTTLGSKTDEQKTDSLHGESYKNYYLHYNFPPYSVGECGRLGTPGRREIGHGHLAERSLEPVLPTSDSFPYTIRIVSEILESNGSSSMASVCGGSLALMDAGVPIKTHVAGVAMGLISDGKRVKVLTDITGTEDHLGDMDFKICGTADGITALQMDIKIKGITTELMLKALKQAKDGRMHILGLMKTALEKPKSISQFAPSILHKKIPSEKIKDLIGPGGKVIRGIQDATGANLDISDTGEVTITGPKQINATKAIEMIEELFKEVEVGVVYKGKVKNITNFGAFVEVLPGKEGLVHISELGIERGKRVEDFLSTGDVINVKCIEVDPQGRVRLSAKQAEPAA